MYTIIVPREKKGEILMKTYLLWYRPIDTTRNALYCVCATRETAENIGKEIVRDNVAACYWVNEEMVWE